MLNNVTGGGKIIILILLVGIVMAGVWGFGKIFPKSAKEVTVTTKATALPPLVYDKNSNAQFRKLPNFNDAVTINSPVIRGHIMEWYSQMGLLYAVGGMSTSDGSIAQELGLNIQLDVQNNCGKQAEDLYAFADEFSKGSANPTKGAHFIAWMGDGVPSYFYSLEKRLVADFGEEYRPKVITFGGASAGEDKWLVKKKFAKDARGSITCTVLRDGDWNICQIKSQLMGWDVNYQDGTYDPTKVNFIPAPNDDYLEAAKFFISGQKVKLKLIKDGKLTDKDTLIAASGVSTWFPGDFNVVIEKGGVINLASTKDFGSQMPNAIIFIDKWAKDNKELMVKFCAMIGLGGDQVKSHASALDFAAKVGKEVFKSTMSSEDIVKAYKSYDYTDDDENTVNIGGSRVFNLADAATFAGVVGGQDKYKYVYNTFGAICTEAYPELIPSYPAYENATDWSYLSSAYNTYKAKAGNVSKVDFKASSKTGEILGDAAYSIEFALGSDDIKPVSYSTLDKILSQLTIADNSFVDIEGHTDNTGTDEINIPLSKARAEAVKNYLTSKDGDLKERISTEGFGSTKPISSNNNKNRRVEIKLTRSSQ